MKLTKRHFNDEPKGCGSVAWSYTYDEFEFEKDGKTISFRRYTDESGVAILQDRLHTVLDRVELLKDSINYLKEKESVKQIKAYNTVLGTYAELTQTLSDEKQIYPSLQAIAL
jgi:hypothetical protein